MNDGEGGGERRNRLPANPTILKNCVRKSFLLQFLQSPATCSIREQSNFTNLVIQGVICSLCFYFDELSIYKWTEPWNIKGRFPESWGLRASVSSSPLPLRLQPYFCFRSNFRAITRLETLATQATVAVVVVLTTTAATTRTTISNGTFD